MRMQHLLQPFEVENLIADQCPIKPHKHSFFELVYILEGHGSCIIDNHRYFYSRDDLFVIVPENGHHTIVEGTTSFVFIRFNSDFLKRARGANEGDESGLSFLNRIEFIFSHQQRLKEGFDAQTRNFLRSLCTTIVEEASRTKEKDHELLHQLINTMLMLIVSRGETGATRTRAGLPDKSSIRAIIDYIHQNIKMPEKLRVESIAAHVNMSKSYVNEYFRKYYPKSLQQYITDYKFQLVEERLRRSDLRLSEIAFEFGFSGESHLAAAFKKQKGVSPIRYRKVTSEAR